MKDLTEKLDSLIDDLQSAIKELHAIGMGDVALVGFLQDAISDLANALDWLMETAASEEEVE